MVMRELGSGEVYWLEECLRQLAEHHNEVSTDFKGCYPKKPFAEILKSFEEDLGSGKARIAAIEESGEVLGFCKISEAGDEGTVDYLVVRKVTRGKGCGDALFGWALEELKQSGARRIEVKVVAGNDAIRFYEKHGFRICSLVLRKDI